MGCVCSNDAPILAESPDTSTTMWRPVFTKAEARKIYEEEGTIPTNCDDSLLELRLYLTDPVLVNTLGSYAKSVNKLYLLKCWIEMLLYKSIDETSLTLQAIRGYAIFSKYIKLANFTDNNPMWANMLNSESLIDEVYCSLTEAKVTATTLSSDLFDCFQHHCFFIILNEVFLPFKNSPLYGASLQQFKQLYNRVEPEHFEYFEKLGSGGFGLVVRCLKKSTGKYYAMKIQTKDGLINNCGGHYERVTLERNALVLFRHPYIISMDYAFQTGPLVMTVMQLGIGMVAIYIISLLLLFELLHLCVGTLKDAAMRCPNKMLPEARVRFYSAEIVLALAYMHRLGIIYRDMKPQNILLSADGHVKLADLGGIADVGKRLSGHNLLPCNDLFAAELELKLLEKSDHSSSMSRRPIDWSVNRHPADNVSATRQPMGIVSAPKHPTDNVSATRQPMDNSTPKHPTDHSFSPVVRSDPASFVLRRAFSYFGTNGFAAPEMLKTLVVEKEDRTGYTNIADYWGLGVTMYNLLTGKLPFDKDPVKTASTAEDVNSHYIFKGFPPECSHLSPECVDIVTKFLVVDDAQRLGSGRKGSGRIQIPPFFSCIDWQLLAVNRLPPPEIPPEEQLHRVCEEPVEGVNFPGAMRRHNVEHWIDRSLMEDHEQQYFLNWYVLHLCLLL